jgi:hypothetical protein
LFRPNEAIAPAMRELAWAGIGFPTKSTMTVKMSQSTPADVTATIMYLANFLNAFVTVKGQDSRVKDQLGSLFGAIRNLPDGAIGRIEPVDVCRGRLNRQFQIGLFA